MADLVLPHTHLVIQQLPAERLHMWHEVHVHTGQKNSEAAVGFSVEWTEGEQACVFTSHLQTHTKLGTGHFCTGLGPAGLTELNLTEPMCGIR